MKMLFVLVSLLLFAGTAGADTRYIVDEATMPVRSGAGEQYRIVRMIPSGQAVDVLEQAEGYAHIRMSDGKTGWILSRYLMNEPAAKDRLQQLNQELSRLDEVNQQKAAAEAQIKQLKTEADGARQALSEYKAKVQDISDSAHQRWFMLGGGAICVGIVLGLILPHLRVRRRRHGGF